MPIKRLTLAFSVDKEIANGNHYARIPVARGKELNVSARSEAKARIALEQEIRLHVGKSLATESGRAYSRCVIGTIDGHVLVLGWQHETSEFFVSVCGPDRTNASSTHGRLESVRGSDQPDGGLESADEAREYMRQYARNCFGGIAWENR